MPAILFKTATKQLHEGFKAARDRLSAGSTGLGSRPNSFASRGGRSGNASFNSNSSDSNQKAGVKVCCEDKNESEGASTSGQRYTTPQRDRPEVSIFRVPELYHTPDSIRATQDTPRSTSSFTSLSSGISALLSPKSVESNRSHKTVSSIANMFRFKRWKISMKQTKVGRTILAVYDKLRWKK
jgi:hypothetical protein